MEVDLVERAVAAAHAQEWAYVLAATARVCGDLDVAEDCVQDAYAAALVHWRRSGVPRRPGAWLTTTATREALQRRRRARTLAGKLPLLVPDLSDVDHGPEAVGEDQIEDDRLRLIFTCCHPALAREQQIALTLRLVCGLSTPQVARALLVTESAMQARITRAKHKISAASIPYRVPETSELADRVAVVTDVVHLVYTEGHTARAGDDLVRSELTGRGIDLARMLHQLLPEDPEVAGLLALMLLTQSRESARVADDGSLVLLADQDRSVWDRPLIDEGLRLVEEALTRAPAGRFGLLAAIAGVHADARTWEDTDWPQILGLYDLLARRWPSPVVALNRAVAVGFVSGPRAALVELDRLADDPGLAGYPYLASTRADLLRRAGDLAAAQDAYAEALLLTENAVEADFLQRRLDEVRDTGTTNVRRPGS
ncbi:MAG TPA: DUF6596 domain-containing protein [Microlunatus sp.]